MPAETKENMETLSQVSHSPDQSLNLAPSKYKLGDVLCYSHPYTYLEMKHLLTVPGSS